MSKLVEQYTEQLLEGRPLTGTSSHHRACNQVMQEYIDAVNGNGGASFAKALKLKPLIKTAVIKLVYRSLERGTNPKAVPVEYMRYAIEHPLSPLTFLTKEQRARVRSPLTGIRAFCIDCQGGNMQFIRDCAATSCPLWCFRMGNNPFFGKLGAEADEALTDAEVDVALNEDDEEELQDADQQA